MAVATLKLLYLLLFDAGVTVFLLAVLWILSRVKPATFAVIRRNFVGYFSNPTGYVFIAVFMLLCSVAAFWPQAFFNDNLATLYQLNQWFAPVMLIFIPAITMGIWSEERHEGTDELLLTMPASDVDIVLGKYLAAVFIFTVALFFSQVANFRVLIALAKGDLDVGLFVATYGGYLLMGLAMLAIGMTASFFTSNLTVGYILGVLFNAPLVFLTFASRLVPGRSLGQALVEWSLAARFRDFGRGVVSGSSAIFFLSLVAIGIYVSLVLIARRHWRGGRDGRSLLGHYLLRTLAMLAIAFGVTSLVTNHDWFRFDLTQGKVSSLASETERILREIPADKPVTIEAYVGSNMPESYVETRVDLINTLRELDAVAGAQLRVQIHDGLEPFTEEASTAEQKYGIKPETVFSRSKGRFEDEEFILGAAITSGLERVVIPFFGRGIPVEYELARSIRTVSGAARQRLGIVRTDAQMFGGFDMATMQSRPKQRMVEELEKQYEVDQVDASNPIELDTYDVLMVVQPSSLTPPQLDHLVAAVRDGTPTAIFEDPLPFAMGNVPGTGEPRRPSGNPMFGGGPPPEPKCDVTKLWDVLGIEMVGEPTQFGEGYDAHVVFQDYNPYPKVSVDLITKEWVFASPEAPSTDDEALSRHDIVTDKLQEVLCIYPGAIRNLGAKGLDFTTLMKTGEDSGWVRAEDCRLNDRNRRGLLRAENVTRKKYVLAARIKGLRKEPLMMGDAASPAAVAAGSEDSTSAASTPEEAAEDSPPTERRRELHVVYTTDIDLMSSEFLTIREQADDEINWRFDNVTYVLNVVDSLVGENDLIEIRKRKPRHSTLKRIDDETEEFKAKAKEEIDAKELEFEEELSKEEAKVERGYAEFREKVTTLEERLKGGDESVYQELRTAATRLAMLEQLGQTRVQVTKDRIERDLARFQERNRRELQRNVERVQMRYKLDAVWPSLVLPLIVGLGVWIVRTQRERESVTDARRR